MDQGGNSHRAAGRASPPDRPPSMGGSGALPAEAEDTRAQKTVGPLHPGLRELGWCNRVSLTPSPLGRPREAEKGPGLHCLGGMECWLQGRSTAWSLAQVLVTLAGQ